MARIYAFAGAAIEYPEACYRSLPATIAPRMCSGRGPISPRARAHIALARYGDSGKLGPVPRRDPTRHTFSSYTA